MKKTITAILFAVLLTFASEPPARSHFQVSTTREPPSNIGAAIDLRGIVRNTHNPLPATPDNTSDHLLTPNERTLLPRTTQSQYSQLAAEADPDLALQVWVSFKNNAGDWKPVRLVKVEVWDKDELSPDDLLATDYTDTTGYVRFTVDSADPEPFSDRQDIFFKIWCTNDRVDVDNGISTYVSISTVRWNLSSGTHNYDFGVADNQNAAFNINDTITKASQFVSLYDNLIAKVDVVWPYNFGGLLSYYNDAINTLFLENGYEWNEAVILHEYGHFVTDIYSDFFPAFPFYGFDFIHNWDSHETNATAWLEGWAGFFSCAARDYWYPKNKDWTHPQLAGYQLDIETSADWPGENTRDDVEAAAATILWDIYDDQYDEQGLPYLDNGDTLQAGFAKIWDVFHNYDPLPLDPVHNHPWTIHEFWDGWFARGHGFPPEMWAIYNQHGVRKADDTPPSNPASIVSASHAIGVWSRNQTIQFGWSGATDNLSGVRGYAFNLNNSAVSEPDTYFIFTTNEHSFSGLVSTLLPYYFHIKTLDHAGNWTEGTAHNGPYLIDTTLPSAPTSCSEIHGVVSDSWQNTVSQPTFTWSGASDSLSGISGYYWSCNISPIYPSAWTTAAGCTPFAPGWDIVLYLNVMTRDNAGNYSTPSTLFIFKYDKTAPANGSVVINGGDAYTNSASVTLTLSSADVLSGVCHMKIFDQGVFSITYEPYSSSKSWTLRTTIPGESGPKTVLAYFKDCAGNESSGASDTIILDRTAPTGSIKINGGAAQTGTLQVRLDLTAADTYSGVSKMRFSNNGSVWSEWEAVAGVKLWGLTPGIGTKYVSVQYRDTAGNVSVAYRASIDFNGYMHFFPMVIKP